MIETTTLKGYCMYKLVFSLLLGWIVVATFVDINVLLVAMGVSTTMQFYVTLVSLTGMLTAAGSVFDLVVILVISWAMVSPIKMSYIILVSFDSHVTLFIVRLESLSNSRIPTISSS